MRDVNALVDRLEDRRIEVIVNGLPLWNGAQLAVDTTIVSPLTRDAAPRCRRNPAQPVALFEAGKKGGRKKQKQKKKLKKNKKNRRNTPTQSSCYSPLVVT